MVIIGNHIVNKRIAAMPDTDRLIAGALVDFMGYLTTRPEKITVGSNCEVYDAHEALAAWAELRGLNLEGADVMNWNEKS